MKTLRFLAICAIALFCGYPPLFAIIPTSEYVNFKLIQDNKDQFSCLLSWETIEGDIYITMSTPSDADGSPSLFRGATGMANVNLDSWKVGDNAAKSYFYREYLGGKTNQMILRRRPNVNIPKGTKITCNQGVEWWNGSISHNKQLSPQWSYSYGTTCGTLSAPMGLSLSDGVISFGSVTDATSYKVRVYADGNFVYEQDLNSTQATLNYAAYKSARYMVTVQALNATTYSDESDSVQWNFATTDISNIRYIKSWAENVVFSTCDDSQSGYSSRCYMKGETRFGKDNDPDTLVFTLSPYTSGKEALWRGNTGLNQTDLKYNGEALTNYFDKVASPEGKTELRYTTKNKANLTYGGLISYNASNNRQAAEWYTDESGSKTGYSSNYMTFFMLYGTNFDIPTPPTPPTPGIPQITNIAANNVITFTGIDDATQYNLRVTNSSDGDVYSQTNITSGATIAYYCYETGTYKVYIDAIKESETVSSAAYSWNVTKQVPVISTIDADWKITFTGTQCAADSYNLRVLDGETNVYTQTNITSGATINFSDYHTRTYKVYVDAVKNSVVVSTSVPFDWALVNPSELPPSEDCNLVLGADNTLAYLTWETIDNNVVITISGSDATCFRGSGMGGTLKVEGNDWNNYFTKTYTERDKKIVLVPKQPIANLTKITYSGNVEYITAKDNNAANQHNYTYQYGTVCANKLAQPTIESIDANGIMTLSNKDANASAYKVFVYRETTLVYQTDVEDGEPIDFIPMQTADYNVYVQAIDDTFNYVSSNMSSAYIWTLSKASKTPYSAVCEKLVKNENGGIYLTIETNEQGGLVFKLSGDASHHPTWRNQMQQNFMKINGQAISTYFDTPFTQGKSTYTYTVKNGSQIQYGDLIEYNGLVEWSVEGNTNASYFTYFRYIYGTSCPTLIVLSESVDNSTILANYNDKTTDVTLQRTFIRDSYNYTLCLPFDMTEEQCLEAFGEGYKLWAMGEAYKKSADMIYLPFSEVTSIKAGKPYIFCPKEGDEAIVNPTIAGVTINAAAPASVGNALATMTGIYSPYTLPIKNNYVLGSDNWLYQSAGNEMLGLRCYFTFGSSAPAGVSARAIFNRSDVVTDFEPIDGAQSMPNGKYIIDGRFVILRNNARYNGMGQQVK